MASAGRSMSGLGGGVGLAERSGVSTGFSSRGLATFNTGERSVMSSMRTAGPSFSMGRSERPSLSLGKADKPSLSFKGTSFESTKNITGKTGAKTFASASENFAQPAKTDVASGSKTQANGIEVASIMPQTKSTQEKGSAKSPLAIDRLQPFQPKLQAEPKGLVTQKNLDASVPIVNEASSKTTDIVSNNATPAASESSGDNQAVANNAPGIEKFAVVPQPQKDMPLTKMEPFTPPAPKDSPQSLVTKNNIDKSVPYIVPGAPEVAAPIQQTTPRRETSSEPASPKEKSVVIKSKGLVTRENLTHSVPLTVVPEQVSSEQKKEETPVKVVIKDVFFSAPKQEASRVTVAPKVAQVMVTEHQAEAKDEAKPAQKSEKAETTVTVNAEKLAMLAQLDLNQTDDKKKREEKEHEVQDQIEAAAYAYVRAGLARDFGEGVRKTERFLLHNPVILATNELKVKKIVEAGKKEQQKVATPVAESANMKATAEVVVYANEDPSEDQQVGVIDTIHNDTNNENQNNKRVTFDEAKEEKEDEPQPEVSFKVDEQAQKNRELEWEDAVRQMFPAFDFESQAPLSQVASILKPPSRETNSTLIYQVGKSIDGSNNSEGDWRTPLLTNNAPVTATQARITGIWEIYTKPPVVMKRTGRNVAKKDVDLVLSGDDTKDRYGLPA